MGNPFRLIRYYPLTTVLITILIIIEYIWLSGIYDEHSFKFVPTLTGLNVLWKYFKIPIGIMLTSVSIIPAINKLDKNIFKNTNHDNLPSIFEDMYDRYGKKYHYLNVIPAYDNQILAIIERPEIYKIKYLIFYKYIEPEIHIIMKRDKQTNKTIENKHYIDLLKLSQVLDKGKYLIKVKINIYPYFLKYRFKIPLSKYIKRNLLLLTPKSLKN